MRKETKSGQPPANLTVEPGAEKNKSDTAVLQSLIDFLRYPHQKTCHRCQGRKVNYANTPCETCKGTGKETINVP